MRGYDIDDPARHLPFPKLRARSGWGLTAPQVYGGDQLRLPVMSTAACAGSDPELFFSGKNKIKQQTAKRICRFCPIIEQCLSEAMRPNEIEGKPVYVSGVWGGTTEHERSMMRLNGSQKPIHETTAKPQIIPKSEPNDRIQKALQAGRIVIDRGDDPALILPASATVIAERLESQGYKRMCL